MKKLEDIAVLVQARLHSERIPQKMIKPFAATNLLDIAVEKMLTSTVFDASQLFLAVHEPELVEIGKSHGVNIFHRSERSARAEGVPLTLLYEWWDRLPFTFAVLVNPCAPLLRIETIDAFVRQYFSTDGLLLATRIDGCSVMVAARHALENCFNRLCRLRRGHLVFERWCVDRLLDN